MGDRLNHLLEYLRNPVKSGVYSCKVRISLRSYDKLVDHVVRGTEKGETTRVKGHLKLEDTFSIASVVSKIGFALNEIHNQEKCPKSISDFLEQSQPGRRGETPLYEEIFGEEYPVDITEPLILPDHFDVLSVDVTNPAEDELRMCIHVNLEDLDPLTLELISIKDIGVNHFLKFLKSIPDIRETVGLLRQPVQTFSSRYSYRPYPLAVRLWLSKIAKMEVPRDLCDFIDKASVYHILKEWRTSIVLSAITVESLLADLYEEGYQEPSPERATLGELNEFVKKKIDFPPYIMDSITRTNSARISAVHRSLRLAVSEREATNALFGVVNLTMWYFSDYKKP